MNIQKTLKTFATLAVAFGIAFAAEAKNYTTVFTQDFEDPETYTENMSGGSVTNTLFGTSTSSSGSLPGTPTQAHRTVVGSATGSNFYSIYSTWRSGNLLFTIPDAVTNAVVASQDYIVEFDYYLNFITTSTYSGLAIQGANGPIATFYAGAGSRSGESTGGKLYLGDTTDTELITQVKGYKREADPSSSNCDKYWLHVTIKGVNTESDPTKNGIYMTVVRNNMTTPATLLAETRICGYDVVTHLFQRFSTGNTYSKYVSLDDVSVGTAVSSKTFTWTGAAGDGKWATPGNWTVGSVVQTEYSPTESDTAEINIADQTIYVTPGQKFGTVTADASTTFAVLFTEDNQQFTPPTSFGGAVIAAGPFSVTSEAGVYTATRKDSTFVWANAEGGDWAEAANWTVDGRATAVLPNAKDTTIFNDAVTVTTTGTALTSNLVINAVVTIADTGDQMLSIGDADNDLGATVSVSGTGSLVLSGARVRSGFTVVNLDVPVEIAANTTNVLLIGVKKDVGGYGFNVNKAVTGSGKIEVTQTTGENNAGTGVRFIGDMSGFTGSVEFYQGRSSRSGKYSYQSRALDLIYPSANGENAAWNIYADHWGDIEVGRDSGNYFAESDATYKFGALKLRLPQTKNDRGYCTNVTLEVGKLDLDSYAKYSWKSAKNCGINWIAPTATFVNEAANTAFLKVSGGGVMEIPFVAGLPTDSLSFTDKGGTLKVGYDLVVDSNDASITNAVPVDPSAVIMNSTAAITFDDQGTNCTWATPIANSNVGGLTKKGAGTLTLVKGQTLNGPLVVKGGKIGIVEDLSGEEETLLTWTTAGSSVTTADFAVEVVSPFVLALVADAEAGTTSLAVQRPKLTYTWTGAADNRWANAANWTVGGEVTEHYPTDADNAAFNDEVATVVAIEPDMTAFASMTGTNKTTFAILFTAKDASYTVPTGMTTNQFVAAPPFESVWEEGKCVAGSRAASTYVWAGGNGVWNNAQNWKIGSDVTGVWPTTGDTASFTAAANGAVVALASGITISGATIAEGATITYDGSAGEVELAGNVEGKGTLVLSNVTWKTTSAQKYVYIGVAIDVPTGSTANFHIRDVKNDTGYGFAVTNKFTGSGTIAGYSEGGNNTWTGLNLKGDGSKFAGTVKFNSSTSQNRDSHSLEPSASSSNAVWRFYTDAVPKALGGAPFKTEGTYYLGAVQYKLYDKNTAEKVTYEIGALDQDSYIESVTSKFGSNNNINWIAPNATFTCAVSNVNILATLGGGTIVIASEGALPTGRILFSEKGGTLKTRIVDDVKIDPSSKFTKCKAAICFDDEGEDYTWAAALAASNEGGLTKKGTGTLTLVEKPLYEGLTTVEAGTLALTNGTELSGALCISNDAKVAVSSESLSTSPETLLTWNYDAEQPEVTLDDFTLTLTPSTWLDYAIVTNDTTVSLVTQRVAADYTFKGVDGGLWSDATNWTVSTVETPFAPSTDDNATINAAVTVTTAVGQVVKTLTLADGAKLAFDLKDIAKNEQVTLFAVGAGETCPLTENNVLISGYDSDAYAVKYDTSDTTRISVGLYDKTRFVWTGDGDDTLFATIGNWAYGATNGPAATTAPTDNSTVTFPATFKDGVSVTFNGNTAGGIYFVLDCGVTFASDDNKTREIYPWSIKGEGTLSLANYIKLQTVTYKAMTVDVDLNVLPSAGDDPWASYAQIYLRGNGSSATINGAITGTGYLKLLADSNVNKNYYLKGDLSDFAGKLYTEYTIGQDKQKNPEESLTTHFYPASMDLGKATWEIAGRVYVEGLTNATTMAVGALVGSATTARIYNETTYPITLAVGNDTDASSSVRLTGDGEYGAWTIKKVGTGRQTFTNTAMTNNIELTAGELMLPENTVASNVTFTAGKFVFAYNENWTVGTATNVMTMTTCTGTIARDNVVIDGIPAEYDWTVDNTTDPTKLAITITEDVTYIWTNGSEDKLWTTLGNWKLSNGTPVMKYPGEGDMVQLGADAVVVVTPGQTFGTVTAESTAKLAVQFTDSALSFTAPTDFAGEVVAAGPYTLTGESGVYTATRVPSTFAWTDATDDHEWNTVGNWKVGTYPTAVLPNINDHAEFPANDDGWTLSVCGNDANASNITFAANVTLSDCTKYLRPKFIGGAGIITLGDDAKIAHPNATLTITNGIVVAAADDKVAEFYIPHDGSSEKNAYPIELKGTITGSGTFKCAVANDANYNGLRFYGDMRAFTGCFKAPANNIDRNVTQFHGEYSWSEQARFEISAGSGDTCARSGSTFKFGSFNGKMNMADQTDYQNMTIEVGNLNSADDDIAGTFFSSSYPNLTAGRGHTLRKVGTGTLEVSVINNKAYDVNNGVMRLMNDRTIRTMWIPNGKSYKIVTDPAEATGSNDVSIVFSGTGTLALHSDVTLDISACIKGSTGAISIDDGGTNRTWTTALDDSNKKHEIVKDGSGTLTLNEKPTWDDGETGNATTITVKSGKLVLPSTAQVVCGEKTQQETVGETIVLKPADATISSVPVTGDPSKSFDVTVSQDWVADKLVGKTDAEGNVYTQETASQALTNATLNANGLPAWQSYALGLEPSVATSIPFVTPQQSPSTTQLTLNLAGVNTENSAAAGTTVLYQIESADTLTGFTGDVSEATSATTYTVNLPESGVKYYRVNVKFDQPTND